MVMAEGLRVDSKSELCPHHELTHPQQRTVYFPAVHQTDRETASPDLSISISNTVLIPSGSKEAASFASLSLETDRRLR